MAKPTSGTIQPAIKKERTFYFLNELPDEWKCSPNDLLDLGANGKLQISIITGGRTLIQGGISGTEGEEVEVPQWDGAAYEPVGIMAEDVWKILATGEAMVEYLVKSDDYFSKFNPPIKVTRDMLVVTMESINQYGKGLPPKVAKAKNEDPRLIGALAFLYLSTKENFPAYWTADTIPKVSKLILDLEKRFALPNGDMPKGLGKASLYAKLNPAIEEFQPIAYPAKE